MAKQTNHQAIKGSIDTTKLGFLIHNVLIYLNYFNLNIIIYDKEFIVNSFPKIDIKGYTFG